MREDNSHSEQDNVPHIYDTYTNSLLSSAHNFERMGSEPVAAQFRAEHERAKVEVERARELFAEHGITVLSTSYQPKGPDDPVSFTLLGQKDQGPSEEEVLKVAIPELHFPERQTLKDFLANSRDLPVVVKNIADNGGMNKYLIEADWQLERLAAWAETKNYLGNWVVEEYIEGPSEYAASYRIVMGATGLPIAASMIRSEEPRQQVPLMVDNTRRGWEGPLTSERSETFLGAREFRSNAAANGHIIPLAMGAEQPTSNTLDDTDAKVLEQHGVVDQQLPQEVLDLSIRIAKLIGPTKALVLGIDFIQDQHGKLYFLEANAVPSVQTVRLWQGLDEDVSDQEVYDILHTMIAKDMNRLYGAPVDDDTKLQ